MPFLRHSWPIFGTKCIQSEFCLGYFTTLNWWLSLSVNWASSPFTPPPWQKWLLILTRFPTFASSSSYKFPLFSSSFSSLPSKMTTCDSDGVAQTQGTGRRQKLASVTQTIGPRRLAKLFKWKLFWICKVTNTVLLSQSTSIAETKMINKSDFILLACRLLVNKPFSYVPLPVSRNLLGAWTFACFFSNCCTWPKVLTFPRSLSTLLSQAIGRSEHDIGLEDAWWQRTVESLTSLWKKGFVWVSGYWTTSIQLLIWWGLKIVSVDLENIDGHKTFSEISWQILS